MKLCFINIGTIAKKSITLPFKLYTFLQSKSKQCFLFLYNVDKKLAQHTYAWVWVVNPYSTPKGSYINHVDSFSDIFDPPPLCGSFYVIT